MCRPAGNCCSTWLSLQPTVESHSCSSRANRRITIAVGTPAISLSPPTRQSDADLAPFSHSRSRSTTGLPGGNNSRTFGLYFKAHGPLGLSQVPAFSLSQPLSTRHHFDIYALLVYTSALLSPCAGRTVSLKAATYRHLSPIAIQYNTHMGQRGYPAVRTRRLL